ncbi:uncharacterized protein OCT59_028219 [Rhizophagus irregularis]|uniref:uncharacterized protein n=1 Tax=Rhizophagus irregularis TaxID=588596 RepID=UPI000CBB19F9|nr:hypothetical protein OCT59_028219 [Rhizophagus irregularis]GBC43398.1 BTB/POZ protein [Rhizophagus irregularis DAOM 181602=DAOM 197198]
MSTKFWASLSSDILHILTDGLEEYNVVIEVGEAPNTKIFQAHSIILRARSPYFRQALSKNWAKKEGDIIKFSKPNISPKVFEVILKFMYSGNVDMMNKSMMEALELLIATDELLLTELSEYVQEYLLHYEVGWLEDNLITLWKRINNYDSCRKLQEYCLSIICKDPTYLFKSPDFLLLDSSLLVSFLKLDNLQIEEVQIWDYLIKWGVAQNENLNIENISQWNKENFEQLGTTLKECIPLIGFLQISSSDFYDKVWPFRDILPKSTLEEVMKYHLKPTTPPKPVEKLAKRLQFDSCLLRPYHVALLSSWIDRIDSLGQKRYLYEENPYRFQLLLRGTRDGFDSSTFHEKCDEKGRTIVVMKIHCTNEIIGGYSPVVWSSKEGYWNTEDSFLFTLGNRGMIEDNKLCRVSRHRSCYAIRFSGKEYGPCFGDKDLSMKGKFDQEGSCSCQKDDYIDKVTDAGSFKIDEYEVFRIIKK